MARAASSRCSSIISRISVSSHFPDIAQVQSTPFTSPPTVTTSKLAAVPFMCYANSRRLCSYHRGHLVLSPARKFSSQNEPTTNQDPLVDNIEQAQNIEELFHILSTNKARFSENHISGAFDALLDLRTKADDQDVFVEMVLPRPEFQTLIDLAENRASTFEDACLVNVLYCSMKFLGDRGHPLIRELRSECLKRLDRFEMAQLSKLSVCLADLGEGRGPFMGRLVNAYSNILHNKKHFGALCTFMRESEPLLSRELKARILKELNIILDSEDRSYGIAKGRPHRKVYMCIHKFTNDYRSTLDKCSQYVLCDLDSMSFREVCIMIACLTKLRYDYGGLLEQLKGILYEQLTTLTDPIGMALSIDLVGSEAPAHVKLQLVENAMKMVDELPIGFMGDLCNGLGKIGYFSRTPLHDKIREKLWSQSSALTFHMMLPVVEYHRKLPWMTHELWQPFGARVNQLVMDQIETVCFQTGFYILSRIPTFRPDDKLLEKALRFLPQCHYVGTNVLFGAMKEMVQGTAGGGRMSCTSQRVLESVQRQAMKSLHKVTRAESILSLMDSVLVGGGDMRLLDALFGQLGQIIHRAPPFQVGLCARNMHRIGYYSEELLDAIMEVTLPVIEKVTPMQVLNLITPFCSFSYQPKHSEAFFDACIDRVVPFMENLPCGYLVDIAHTLSLCHLFPEEIVRRIFSLEFLTKLDEELEDGPQAFEIYRKKLMLLNRAVALECPELQVPWFHEEYCQHNLKKKRNSVQSETFYNPTFRDIQKNLVGVLGGAQYLRSLVTTPYYYQIAFECILDASGTPLTCANYGSGLNHKKGLSGSVLSDLMQWDTERKQLPEGAQRVAIDYLNSHAYCINCARMRGQTTTRWQHLELLGYQYIPIPFFEWQSLALTGREEKEEYLRMKIFASSNQKLPDIASAPPWFQHKGSIFTPTSRRRKGEKFTIADNLDLDLPYDRMT